MVVRMHLIGGMILIVLEQDGDHILGDVIVDSILEDFSVFTLVFQTVVFLLGAFLFGFKLDCSTDCFFGDGH